MAKASTPIRVRDRLLQEAAARGALESRSASQQLEYWAELGKAVSSAITPAMLLRLRAGLAHVVVAEDAVSPVSTGSVLERLDAMRASGALRRSVFPHDRPAYQASRCRPGMLEEHLPNGEVRVGRFRNGVFVAESAE